MEETLMRKENSFFKKVAALSLALLTALSLSPTGIVLAEGEAPVITSLEVVKVSYNENGKYNEFTPSIQVTISVLAKDQNNNPFSGAKLYYKEDESERSYTLSRKTNDEGIAEFKYSYGIGRSEDKADYKAVFATSSKFTEEDVTTTKELHFVKQKADDLVLYTNQIFGTAPNSKDGRVIKVPDNYEIWSGDVHDGALVVGSGEWIRPENGEFNGLSSGEQLLRFGERIDAETGTFYFASNARDFTVPRGTWIVTADEETSENIEFAYGKEQITNPGGTVYLYAQAKEGIEITGVRVNKPNYVKEVRYSKEDGFVVLESVTGNVVVSFETKQQELPKEEPAEEVKEESENTNLEEKPEVLGEEFVNNDNNTTEASVATAKNLPALGNEGKDTSAVLGAAYGSTGDNNPLALLLAIALLSGLTAAWIIKRKKA